MRYALTPNPSPKRGRGELDVRVSSCSMTRLFIAGHSDSGDAFLAPGELPWPELTRRWLEETSGEQCELSSARFAAMGAGAADYLLAKVEAAAPDIVVLPFGAYVCTVGTVAESVRARFGERPARWFRSTEGRIQARTKEGRARRAVNLASRRAARRVLGARTLATVAQTAAIYEEVLHRLARIESLQVIAVADARFSQAIQEREPRLHTRFDQLEAKLLPVVEQHHFTLADLEGALRRAPDRRVFHTADGVHTTAAFHEVYFGVMREALTGLASRRA